MTIQCEQQPLDLDPLDLDFFRLDLSGFGLFRRVLRPRGFGDGEREFLFGLLECLGLASAGSVFFLRDLFPLTNS